MTKTVTTLAAERNMTIARFRKLTGNLLDSFEDWEDLDDHSVAMVEMALPAPVGD